MALAKDGIEYDIISSELDPDQLGESACLQLSTKGFCVIDAGIDSETLQKVQGDIRDMDAMGKLSSPPMLISDGLFGQEGSARIGELDKPGDLSTDGEVLQKLDEQMSDVANSVAMFTNETMDFDLESRTFTLLHETDTSFYDPPPLTENEAASWLNTFVRGKVTMIFCLGPTKGTMELRPFRDEEAEAVEIETIPGTLILVRSDSVWHRHFAHGKVYLLTAFLVEPKHLDKRSLAIASAKMTPVAKAIDNWCLNRVQELKNLQQFGDPTIDAPVAFARAMNQVCFKGQRAAIRTVGGKLPSTYQMPSFHAATASGTDLAEQIPFTRWEHAEFYDPDPEGWRKGKTFLKHFTMVDGIDLFDNKLFGLSPAETASMDPHQTAILECGYEALWQCGYRKKTIMNSLGGIYIGTCSTEWAWCPKSGEGSAACATGGAASITANRFSFCLGLKGPSLALDAEGAASLVAVHSAAEGVLDKGRGVVNAYSLGGGVNYCLYPTWWPQLQAAGLLASDGRCKSFDDSADGYGKGEGIGVFLVKRLTDIIDGQQVVEKKDEPLLGVLAASFMNSNGINSSMGAPSAAAEQEMIHMAMRNAGISDVDMAAIECHGDGNFLSDAIEAGAFLRALRFDEESTPEPLLVNCVKTNAAHSVYATGCLSLLRVLQSTQHGLVSPNIHLRILNPHMEFGDLCHVGTEPLEHRNSSTYMGCTAKGFGGTNVHAIVWGKTQSEQKIPLHHKGIVYWPGGGGELDDDAMPRKKSGYFIAGTWSRWKPQQMEEEGQHSFGYTMVLGENRWEEFQIWLDGNQKRKLYPPSMHARKGTAVLGPVEDAMGMAWAIDGRPWAQAQEDKERGLAEYRPVDFGKIGDKYRIHLRVNGKYRTVEWEKLEMKDGATPEKIPEGTYSIMASWNGWKMEEMHRDDSEAGTYYIEVTLRERGGTFQLVRDEDLAQVIYPERYGADETAAVLGPDSLGADLCWSLNGSPKDVFRIQLTRSSELGLDRKKVSWTKLS